MSRKQDVYDYLTAHDIPFQAYDHPATPTIEEAESGAIDATEILSDVHVYAAGNAVVVDGAAAGTQVSVIGLSGYAAQNAVADGSTLSLTIEQKGLFLVKVGTSVFKVIL